MTPEYRQTVRLFSLIGVLNSIAAVALGLGLTWLMSDWDQGYILIGIVASITAGVVSLVIARSQLDKLIATIGLSLLVFMVDTTFRSKEFADIGLDWQNLIKLGLFFIAFVLGVAGLGRTYRHFYSLPLRALTGYVGVALLSSLYSPVPAYTFAAAFGFLGIVLSVPWVLDRLSPRRFIHTLIFTFLFLQIASWLWYMVTPEQATLTSWTPEGGVERLRGIVEHANSLGRIAAISLGLCITSLWAKWDTRHKLLLPIIALSLWTLVETQNRASMVALAGALGFIWVLTHKLRKTLIYLIIGLILVTFWLISNQQFLQQGIIAFITRTGDVEELVTFNRRISIWQMVWPLIQGSPWIGYGYASTRVILPQIWDLNSRPYTNSHNALLESVLYVGIIGTAFLIISSVAGFFNMLHALREQGKKSYPFAFMLLFNVVSGLVEYGMVGVPNIGTITFVVGIAWFSGNTLPRKYSSQDRSRPRRHTPSLPTHSTL